tara:strand:+ start:214 stop:987 length:774 start_codon:yes stop_codon:yes gene_type:complete
MPFIGKQPPITTSVLEDADQDTKIQVEESADEDTIRFDIAGAEVATLTNSSLVLKGTTPTLTIGDAGAEDAKIVFDGNAQDFHIGLDDTADDLVIGLGSALGTTPAIVIDETGAVTKPLQPAFQAQGTAQNNVTGDGTAVTLVWSERFDQNADFDGTSTFTAPVTGKYLIGLTTDIRGLAAANTVGIINLITSNLSYPLMNIDIGNIIQGALVIGQGRTVVADMDAADTATVVLDVRNGSQVVDVTTGGVFYGCLLA